MAEQVVCRAATEQNGSVGARTRGRSVAAWQTSYSAIACRVLVGICGVVIEYFTLPDI